MPGLDKTGPMGQGAGTGRGLGNCSPEEKVAQPRRPRAGRIGQGRRPRGRNNN
ncbi:MAG: DUF5320 domain-containing protein [bacterium]